MKAIAAMSLNGVIGNKGKIPWKLKEDMKWFKKFTMGKRILVGRKTYDTLPPLAGREIWVLSKHSLPEASFLHHVIHKPENAPNDIIVAGGEQVYNVMLPKCNELYLTIVKENHGGDAFMPDFNSMGFKTFEIIEQGERYEIRRYFKLDFQFPQVNC